MLSGSSPARSTFGHHAVVLRRNHERSPDWYSAEKIWTELIVKSKGNALRLTGRVIEELRQKRYPKLLMKQAS